MRQVVRIKGSGGRTAEGLMIDLSSGGCQISNLGGAAYAADEAVTVEIGKLKVTGRVRWGNGRISGVQFDSPIPAEQLDPRALELRRLLDQALKSAEELDLNLCAIHLDQALAAVLSDLGLLAQDTF